MSHIRHYRVLPWATGPLTLLESIAKVPDRQVAKTGKSSIFWLSFFLSFFSPPRYSTITAEAITNAKEQHKSLGIVLTTYCSQERTWTSRWFSGNPTLMLAAICHFVSIIAITSTEVQLSTRSWQRFVINTWRTWKSKGHLAGCTFWLATGRTRTTNYITSLSTWGTVTLKKQQQ